MSTATVETRTTGAPSGALDPDHAMRAMWADWQRLDALAGALGEEVDRIRNAKAKRAADALLSYLYRRLDALQGQIFAGTPRSTEGAELVERIAAYVGTEQSEAQAAAAVRRFRLARAFKPTA